MNFGSGYAGLGSTKSPGAILNVRSTARRARAGIARVIPYSQHRKVHIIGAFLFGGVGRLDENPSVR
jgi:hypothetical protein